MQVASPNSALLASIPADVWLTILDPLAKISGLEDFDVGCELYERHHQLRLVCKHFNSLFQQFPQLSESIWLCPGYPATCIPSLLGRIQRNSGSIVSLISWRTQTDVLLCAVQHAVQLTKFVLHDATAANVALLSALSTMQCCELYQGGQGMLDLQPTGALIGLQRLKLCCGLFSNLQLAAHLTSLEIVYAQASRESECQTATSLRELILKSGHLHGLHSLGISGCTSLQRFVGNPGSFISAGSRTDELNLRMHTTHIPAVPCKLVNLTELSFGVDPQHLIDLDMQWMYQLTALQSLYLYFTNVAVNIGQHMTQLSSLSMLSLSGDHCRINVQWHLMHALRCVTFHGAIDFWANMSDLVRVNNLQSLTLDNCLLLKTLTNSSTLVFSCTRWV